MRTPQPLARRQFASDNYAGIAPEALQALAEANRGHTPAYGEDEWTAVVSDHVRELFEIDCEVFFTFNGTAANSLALASLCQPYHSVICHQTAHIETDECGGPEFFSNGTKVLLVGGENGKICCEDVADMVTRRADIHYPKPHALSITQATELGTVYQPDELDAVAECARRFGLRIHMDGARFANALASLNLPPKAITWKVGVDVLCLGGTKLGMPVGEMIVFFNKNLAAEFAYRCKQAGQLASKMRFMAAPWLGMLRDGAWLRHARHANARATQLAQRLSGMPGLQLVAPTEANAVFAKIPETVAKGLLQRGWRYYTFIGNAARFMCSWDTSIADVDALADDIEELLA